jgi:aerobic C4-dicarboxylate transport protein
VAAYEGKGLGQLLLNALQANILLKVLVGSVLVGLVLRYAGKRGQQGFNLIRGVSKLLFKGINLIMWVSPVVALSAMASTIGKSGLGSLVQLGQLVVTFYGACVVFVAVVLGTIARWHGFSIWKLVRYLKDEIFLVYGTSTSDVVLPRLMDKLEAIGADRSVVGLVTPAGYSLNLDGSNIYLPLGALFIAQATNTPVGLGEQLWLLALLVLTSKGVAPVAGAGFIVLCTTLTTLGGTIPLVGLAVIFGVEPFMGRGCAVTNVIGNATASLVLARRFGVLDDKKLKKM